MNVKKLNSFQVILLGFAGVIILGACLLSLPISSSNNQWTSFGDCLFTSTSAVCVTGLVVFDTATYWSVFGQIVILFLIQIGGMGIVTLFAFLAIITGKTIGLAGRGTVKEAISAPNVGDAIKLVTFILKGIFIIELIGAIIMMPVFCIDFGVEGIWLAVFHSISAFCNAGFDIMGDKSGQFSSLTYYANNPIISTTISLLIIIGGIGFLCWKDMLEHKFKFKRYSMQSKLVLIVTLFIIIVPMLYLFFFEFNEYSFGQRLLFSLFQAITPRTAGFNTADLTQFSDNGLLLILVLMLIGGSSGSTAGGIKVTTLSVLFATAISSFKKKDNAEVLGRRIEDSVVKDASTVFLLYIVLFLVGGALVSAIERLPLDVCLFESASAIATVGLSLGITPTLSIASKIILIILMFFGRVGGLTVVYATFYKSKDKISKKYPVENISVG